MRPIVQHRRWWAILVAIAIAAMGRPAAAQGMVIQADGTVNVGYSQTTQSAVPLDPTAEPADTPASSSSNLFTEIRPAISLQSGSPRLTWRAGYLFSAALSLEAGQGVTYSNQATIALAAQLSKFGQMTVNGSVAQGGTSFLQSQRAAELGQPEIRAPGNPSIVAATLGESLAWQVGRHLSLQQSLSGSATAPDDDLGNRNSTLAGTLSLERLYIRDTVGAEVRASVSRLSPLQADQAPYTVLGSSLLGRWNRDFTWQWNALVMAGVEQTYTATGSRPVALLPTGSVSVRYTVGNVAASLDFNHGTTTNLQVGTVSLTDRISARGVITIDAEKARVLGLSAGFLHNSPLGEASSLVAAGTGDAVQGDAGFTTAITRGKRILATARYSVAYQFGQQGGLGATLAHIFFVGVTGTYTNASKAPRPVPTRGLRVDGSDGQGFPSFDTTQTPETTQTPQTPQTP